MKIKDFLKVLFATLFVANIMACSDDEIGDKFETPIFTVDNTIQFTVNTDVTRIVEIYAHGRFAVDWGDGTIEKRINLEGEGTAYTYNSRGDFQVRIWSDELTFLNISGLMTPMSEPSIGYCPLMKDLILNSFHRTEYLDLTNCPNLETLNIGNYPDLRSLDVSRCSRLRDLQCYTHPQLTSIDLSQNRELEYLSLTATAISELYLRSNAALKGLVIGENTRLTSIAWTRMENLYSIILSRNALISFDATYFPNLRSFSAAYNRFNTLDFSTNKYLYELVCHKNDLENLIIGKGSYIKNLSCYSNNLGVNTLNYLFECLPISQVPATRYSPPPPSQPNMIMFYDNPGTDYCDVQIIEYKGWNIVK